MKDEKKIIISHYKSVKSTIMGLVSERKAWRAGNGDFSRWYKKESDEEVRLFDLSNSEDYDFLTSMYRSLYWTLNFFNNSTRSERIPKSLHNEQGDKITIGSFKDTRTYSLAVDIDAIGDIRNEDIRNSVEKISQYMINKFRKTCPKSVYSCFSGGGIYIYIHQNLFTEKFNDVKNPEYSWRILTLCFNAYIKKIEADFFKENKECIGKVKVDAINNQKRVFKTLFSVHKKYPFAVIPLDVENIKIDIQKARIPLDLKVIGSASGWMKIWDENERLPFIKVLKQFEDKIKIPSDYDLVTDNKIKVLNTKIGKKDWCPFIQKITSIKRQDGQGKISGATRIKAILASFLWQAGYQRNEALEIFKTVSQNVGGATTNIFDSYFGKMSCPSCKTINRVGSGFPHVDMGEFGFCKPNDFCKGVNNPIDFVQKKTGVASFSQIKIMDGKKQLGFLNYSGRHKFGLVRNDNTVILAPTKTKSSWHDSDYYRKIIKKALVTRCGLTDVKADEITGNLCVEIGKRFDKIAKNRDLKQDLLTEINRRKRGKIIFDKYIDARTSFSLTTDGIYAHDTRPSLGDIPPETTIKKIYSGKFKPIENLHVDETFVIRYEIDGVKYINKMTDIILRMKERGGIVFRQRIEDAVSGVCLDLPIKKGHATYGVFKEGEDKLKLCFEALPLKDTQRRAILENAGAVKQEMTKENLKHYLDVIKFWHPYEILPSMGISVLAPFALELRKITKLVCHLVHFSLSTKVGKSTVQQIYTMKLFGLLPNSGDGFNSPFRAAGIIDSIGEYVTIDEIDRLDWDKLADMMKESPANYICTVRGNSDLTATNFLSRAVLGLNCNRFGVTDSSLLVRILKIPFDGAMASKRGGDYEQVTLLKKMFTHLDPIGWRLVEMELEDIDFSFSKLIQCLDLHEKELIQRYAGFDDLRRVTTYAMIYEGLKTWEMAFKKFDLDWKCPTYDKFIKDVIDKIETSTQENIVSPLWDFVDWFDMWKVKNTITRYDSEGNEVIREIKGEGVIWADKPLVIGGKKYTGTIVSNPILREYQRDRKSKIDHLIDLAKLMEEETGIEADDGMYKKWRLGDKTLNCVFIPSIIWNFKGAKVSEREPSDETYDEKVKVSRTPLADNIQPLVEKRNEIKPNADGVYEI